MNDGIIALTNKYISRLSNYGNLPSKPIQSICKLDNKLDWRKTGSNGWSVIAESIFETIKQNNTFSFTNRFTAKATFVGGTLPYVSGLLMSDGRIILVPFNSTTSIIWDPNNDLNTIPAGTYSGISAHSSSVLLPNGEIFFGPRSAACKVYNPITNSVRTIGSAPSTANSYLSSVLMPDGRVYCAAYTITTSLIVDPVNNTTKNATGTLSIGSSGFAGYGTVLLPDGRVFIANSSANSTAWIYDPIKDITSSTRSVFSYSAQGCMLLPDETVLVTSASANSSLMIFDWKKDVVKLSKIVFSSNIPSGGSTLLPDGTIMLQPIGGNNMVIYNPYTDTAINIAGTINNGDFTNGIILFDGRYVLIPRNGTSLVGYGTKGLNYSPEVLLSAHYNLRR